MPSRDCFFAYAGGNPNNTFAATTVGFGKPDWPDNSYSLYRRYNSHDGWHYILRGNEWYLENILSRGDGYTGALQGDSGGALLRDHVLCGVLSSGPHRPEDGGKIRAAAANSPANLAFMLAAPIIDEMGSFMGECHSGPLEGRDVDSDGDLIPDSCDPCPLTPDPDYRYTGRITRPVDISDADNDGFPDACDPCPPSLYIARGGIAAERRASIGVSTDGALSSRIATRIRRATSVTYARALLRTSTQLALTAQEDGSFVLVGRRSLGDHWDAYHFKLDDSEHLVWLGFATGAGKLVGEPLNLGDRLLLPLVQKSEVKLHELDPARFFPNVLGCAEL